MELWQDAMTPAEATGYLRAALEDIEIQKGSLARWLPNKLVADTVVQFFYGSRGGMVEEARYRAFDAEIEKTKGPQTQRRTANLPAIGLGIDVTEYNQIRGRNSDLEMIRNFIQNSLRDLAQGIVDRTERQRGIVLSQAKISIQQDNYVDAADFGRDPSMSTTASALWTDAATSRLSALQTWQDHYNDMNGENPGALLMSTKVLRALCAGSEFATQLLNGASRPALQGDVQQVLTSADLPEIYIYNRKTKSGLVLPDDSIFLLPAPTSDSGESQLGNTWYGQTLTSSDSSYGLAPVDQPGVVAGVYRNPKPPMGAEVLADAIALPVLANANLSMVVKVV